MDKDYFGNVATDYDKYRPRYPSELTAKIMEFVADSPKQRYLDLATGTGQLASSIAPHF